MKKLYAISLGALLALSANAADITIPSADYADLTTFIKTLKGGSLTDETYTVTLASDQSLTERAQSKKNQTLIINGAGHTITCEKSGLWFLSNKDTGELTLENAVVDCKNATYSATLFEASQYNTLNIKDVTIQNGTFNNNQGVISTKGGGIANLNNVKFVNCATAEGKGIIFAGSTVNLSGYIDGATILLENPANSKVSAEGLTSATPAIELLLGNMQAGETLVSNVSNAALFTVDGETLKLGADGSLVYTSEVVNVYNETKGEGYAALAQALNEASDNDVLVLKTNIENTARTNGWGKSLTIKGDTPETTITITHDNIAFIAQGASKMTFENVTFATTVGKFSKQVMEGQNMLNFVNCTFKGFNVGAQGLVKYFAAGYGSIKDCKFVDCTVEGEGSALVRIQDNVNVTVGGNNEGLSVLVGGSKPLTADELTNTTPIELVFSTPENFVSKPVVNGTDNAELFNVVKTTDKTYMLVAAKVEEGETPYLVLAVNSGVDEIGVDEVNAPVEYFNLQGVRVENPANGLYIKRQGSKVEKVMIR